MRHGAEPWQVRPEVRLTGPEERVKGFEQYTPVLTVEQAVREAQRCFGCGCGVGCQICHDICKMFAYEIDSLGRVTLDEEKCVACGMCVQRCPNEVLEMVQTSEEPI